MADTEGFSLFISYERLDSGGWSLTLYDHLSEHFGEGSVFRDAQSIPTGTRWKPVFKRRVAACRGLVLVIGPGWREERVLAKLRDPNGWVYNEILTALEQGKEIFPVLCGGATAPPLDQLPEAIHPALEDFQHFQFHDGPTWRQALGALVRDIAMRTDLGRPAPPLCTDIQVYDWALARLNRNRQASALRSRFERGQRLFVLTGDRRGGFRHFAIRCLLDVMRAQEETGSADGERIVALNWGRFSDLDSPQERQRELLADVSEKWLTEHGRQEPGLARERVAQAARQTRRRTVLYSTVTLGSQLDHARTAEWLDCWRQILSGGSASSVIVILFVEQSWWTSPLRPLLPREAVDAPLPPKLGRIYRQDLRQWLEGDVRNLAQGDLWHRISRRCRMAFRWHWGRSFDDLCEAVIDAWSTGGSPRT
jgi:hypothetical protein